MPCFEQLSCPLPYNSPVFNRKHHNYHISDNFYLMKDCEMKIYKYETIHITKCNST